MRLLLRGNGVLGLLAVGAVIMPHSWLVWCVGKVEPGLRADVLIPYLARALSTFYVLIGALLLVFATDLRRYRVPIRLAAVWTCLSVAALLAHVATRPLVLRHWFTWCVLADGAYALIVAVAVLVLQRRLASQSAPP